MIGATLRQVKWMTKNGLYRRGRSLTSNIVVRSLKHHLFIYHPSPMASPHIPWCQLHCRQQCDPTASHLGALSAPGAARCIAGRAISSSISTWSAERNHASSVPIAHTAASIRAVWTAIWSIYMPGALAQAKLLLTLGGTQTLVCLWMPAYPQAMEWTDFPIFPRPLSFLVSLTSLVNAAHAQWESTPDRLYGGQQCWLDETTSKVPSSWPKMGLEFFYLNWILISIMFTKSSYVD